MIELKLKAKPLVWEKDGEGVWIAYNGGDGPFQIDFLPNDPEEGKTYYAQRNSFEDCEGETFFNLEEAKNYCQSLQNRDVDNFLEFVDITFIQK